MLSRVLRVPRRVPFPTRQLRLRPAIRFYTTEPLNEPREADEVDVCIVGGGPAGLSAAIKLKQLDADDELRVVVLEKAADMGSHIVSGAVLEPRALDELLPSWRDDPPTPCTLVEEDHMKFLTSTASLPLPEPPQMKNKGKNYIVSLNQTVKWLSERAEELGVEVYPGISVSEVLYDEAQENVTGIATNDMGVSRDYQAKDTFVRGMEFHSKHTLFAEGCHGSLTKQLIKKFDLRKDCDPQTYGLGIKEVWEVPKEQWKNGYVGHSVGYPLSSGVYGGGFQYHFGDGLVTLGLIVGLDYQNPYISPYNEFQKMKHHPYYANVLKGGKCISYGARALNEGGWQSIPKLTFGGGALIGASAGFMNVPKIKGTHTAMKTGMLAAEAVYESMKRGVAMEQYDKNVRESWVGQELYSVRNIRPSFNSGLKMWGGLAYSGVDTLLLRGRVPWTFHHQHTDSGATATAAQYEPIEYPKPDGVLSFDLMTSVSRTGTYHDEDEPCHLKVADWEKHAKELWPAYRGIESRFCPAGVYEYLHDEPHEDGTPRFQINAQNCIHCKTCDIKVPNQDINWTVPEGGDGPKYVMT